MLSPPRNAGRAFLLPTSFVRRGHALPPGSAAWYTSMLPMPAPLARSKPGVVLELPPVRLLRRADASEHPQEIPFRDAYRRQEPASFAPRLWLAPHGP